MKILIVGSGGREHALAYALQKGGEGDSRHSERRIFCAPGNAGIAQIATCLPLAASDVTALADYAAAEKIDLTIVGGETALAAGLVDHFEARSLRVAGPRRAAAQLEASKIFAKSFMTRHRIPTARWRETRGVDDAHAVLARGEFGGDDSPLVVKADGLAAGKGVVVAGNRREAEKAIIELAGDDQKNCPLVLEEALVGSEASLLLFADGRNYSLMPAARDHKRIGENDTGPNTGGMGAITAPDVLDGETLAQVVREAVEPTLAGAAAEGFAFRGVLFIGLMLTSEGPRVLEYNVRFGDPEAQAILVRLQSDLLAIGDAIANGTLDRTKVVWSEMSSACIVLAAPGYPLSPVTGARIEGLEHAHEAHSNVRIFHAGTTRAPDGSYLTAGGRVLGVTATGRTLEGALDASYKAVREISWEGMQYRRDIGRFRQEV